ncbi:lethal(2) giant larvae protein homolog Sro7p [Monosporozyma unispora]|nr:hypothetical protein C6P44_004446 [Kazachstania unispora]
MFKGKPFKKVSNAFKSPKLSGSGDETENFNNTPNSPNLDDDADFNRALQTPSPRPSNDRSKFSDKFKVHHSPKKSSDGEGSKLANRFKVRSPKLEGEASKLSDKFKVHTPKIDKSSFKNVSANIKDQTASTESKVFDATVVSTQGVRGKVISIAYDYTQSLMAVATSTAEVHIFGQKQVETVIRLNTKTVVRTMKFIKGIYLVIVDAREAVMVFSLYSKRMLATVYCPSRITCIESDPSLDWILLGLQSGSIVVYDVDRNQFSGVKIENLQKSQFFTKIPLSPVVSISWNPRDLGSILISYELVTVTYSFVEGVVKNSFIYELPPYAPGGEFSTDVTRARRPKVIQSLYNPNSLHILTVHEDNSLVFWDANTGKLIQARTLYETDVNKVQQNTENKITNPGFPKIFKVKWICQNNPEYTSIVIATKASSPQDKSQGISILDLGGTPLYSVTSYDGMSKFYAHPHQEKLCPIVGKAPLVDIIPIATSSPYFDGGHAASCILVLLENGEMETLLSANGLFTSKASLFPQSLSLSRPHATVTSAVSVPSKIWLGMMSSNSKYDGLLKGGRVMKKSGKVSNMRNALLSGHSNGAVRLWDACANELDESAVFEVNIGRVLNRADNVSIANMSFAPDTLELAVAAENGDVALFKYEVNQFFDPQGKNADKSLDIDFSRFSIEDINEPLIDVRDRSPPNVRQGLMPETVIKLRRGNVTALKNSNIGFVGIAYSNGDITVIDRRGPAIIYLDNIENMVRKRGYMVTSIEFVVMQYGDDSYSSILMLCGTDCGELIVNKVLPASGGRFCIEHIEVMKTGDHSPITNILSVATETGYSCEATIVKMQALSNGGSIPGKVITVSDHEVRTIKLGFSKDNSKSYRHNIAAAGLSYASYVNSKGERKIKSYVITYLNNGSIKVLNSSDLKEVKSLHSPVPVHSKYVMQSSVLKDGSVFTRSDAYRTILIATVNKYAVPKDDCVLYNPNLKIPYRPQVNSLQWARGTVYCTGDQLDEILGGTNRPVSKYQESEIAKGTLALKPSDEKQAEQSEHHYVKPVRHGAKSGGYGVLRGMSRAMETQWDAVETQFNDYATAVGEGMNDAMEQTGKDIVKGSFGI